MSDDKAVLVTYLLRGRDALVWKLEGLSDLDVRRPLTPTATNLLGLVKHVAGVTAGYFGESWDRPLPEPLPWLDDGAEDGADMWATAEESRGDVLGLWHRAWAHALVTIESHHLHDRGTVAHWPEDRRHPTLLHLLTHMIAELERHAGQADILREQLDGAIGIRPGSGGTVSADGQLWATHHARVQAAAEAFRRP